MCQRSEVKEHYPLLKTTLNAAMATLGVATTFAPVALDMAYGFIGDADKVTSWKQLTGVTGWLIGGFLSAKIPSWCCWRCCKKNNGEVQSLYNWRTAITTTAVIINGLAIAPHIVDAYKDVLADLILNYTIDHFPAEQLIGWNAALTLLAHASIYIASDTAAVLLTHPINYCTPLPEATRKFAHNIYKFFDSCNKYLKARAESESTPLINKESLREVKADVKDGVITAISKM